MQRQQQSYEKWQTQEPSQNWKWGSEQAHDLANNKCRMKEL